MTHSDKDNKIKCENNGGRTRKLIAGTRIENATSVISNAVSPKAKRHVKPIQSLGIPQLANGGTFVNKSLVKRFIPPLDSVVWQNCHLTSAAACDYLLLANRFYFIQCLWVHIGYLLEQN